MVHSYLKKWKEFGTQIVEDHEEILLCPKVQELVNNFLGKDTWQDEDQMIIFVDQRLIADLLYKTLLAECSIFKGENNNELIDVVYSHSNKGVFQKIMKKTKVESEKVLSIFENVLNLESTQNRSLQSQKRTLDNFRGRKCKILIATNVIEEGLDIPNCNKIIIYDIIQTPKTFIQMSGRARKADSTIYFMCLDTEREEVEDSKLT